MEFGKKRWIALAAAMVCALLAGLVYAWSVFVNPLVAKYEWTTAATSLAYTLNVVFMALVPIFCGKLRAKLTISQYCLVGTAIYCGGAVLCSVIQSSVYELYIYFGVLCGAGNGFIYQSLASYVVQLFPDRKGLAAGLYTSAYGCGALFWAPGASKIIQSTGSVNSAFLYLGLLFLVLLVIATRFLYEIPPGYKGEAPIAAATTVAAVEVESKSPAQLVTSPTYYVALALYTAGLVGGMMVLSLGSPIVQGSLGYSPEKAAVIVGLFSLASTIGRLFWGAVSDKLGRLNVVALLGLITCASMLVLANIKTEAIFLAAILAVPMCYGAYAATLSPVTIETFGPKHFAMNFNMLFVAFGLAALIGPQVVAYIRSASGGYSGAFFYGILFGAISFLLTLVFRAMRKKSAQAGS